MRRIVTEFTICGKFRCLVIRMHSRIIIPLVAAHTFPGWIWIIHVAS